jgi:p21-activated kinase 1
MESDLAPPEKRRQRLVKLPPPQSSSSSSHPSSVTTRDSKLSVGSNTASGYAEVAQQDSHARFSLTHKSSTQLIGPAFDAQDLINQLDNAAHQALIRYNSSPPSPHTPLIAPSLLPPTIPHLQHANTLDERLLSPKLRTSQSHVALGHKMDRITPPRSETGSSGTKSPRQRYSDEAKPEFGSKKKGMFASFLNGVKGSPRRPTISSPVNPTHVTHVSFDQDTGTLTVCDDYFREAV